LRTAVVTLARTKSGEVSLSAAIGVAAPKAVVDVVLGDWLPSASEFILDVTMIIP
jgi:hypothetical protein